MLPGSQQDSSAMLAEVSGIFKNIPQFKFMLSLYSLLNLKVKKATFMKSNFPHVCFLGEYIKDYHNSFLHFHVG
jgi:hypothetical protein